MRRLTLSEKNEHNNENTAKTHLSTRKTNNYEKENLSRTGCIWDSNVNKCTKGEMEQSLYRILKHPESRDKLHCHAKLAPMTHEACFEDHRSGFYLT